MNRFIYQLGFEFYIPLFTTYNLTILKRVSLLSPQPKWTHSLSCMKNEFGIILPALKFGYVKDKLIISQALFSINLYIKSKLVKFGTILALYFLFHFFLFFSFYHLKIFGFEALSTHKSNEYATPAWHEQVFIMHLRT